MKDWFFQSIKRWDMNRVATVLVMFFAVCMTLLLNNRQLTGTRFTNDHISWILPAERALEGVGSPYTDYWDIKPPGLLLMTSVWLLISQQLWWAHAVNILFVLGICLAFWKILIKLFPWYQAGLIFFYVSWIFFGRTVHSQLLPSEINGTLLALWGVVLLLKEKTSLQNIFWASVLFTFAGQMKEVFAFSLLALLPFFIRASLQGWKQFWQTAAAAVAGFGLSMLVMIGYLLAVDGWSGYQEVLTHKSQKFGFTDLGTLLSRLDYYRGLQYPRLRFIRLNYQIPILIAASVLSVWCLAVQKKYLELRQSSLKFSAPQPWFFYWVVVMYWFGMYMGYLVQNRFGSVYGLAIVLPTFLLLSILVKGFIAGSVAIFKGIIGFLQLKLDFKINTLKEVVTLGALAVFLMPHRQFLAEIQQNIIDFHGVRHYVQQWQVLERQDFIAAEKAIEAGTQTDDCIQAVYGWASGAFYHYAGRKPCARHFIPNIITDEFHNEYRQSIVSDLPKAIYYNHAGSDLNISNFESKVFPYQAVLHSCYIQDEEHGTVYWPRPDLTNNQLRSCIVEQIEAMFAAQQETVEH